MKNLIATLCLLGAGLSGAYLLSTHLTLAVPADDTLPPNATDPERICNRNGNWQRPSVGEIERRLTLVFSKTLKAAYEPDIHKSVITPVCGQPISSNPRPDRHDLVLVPEWDVGQLL